jgi:tetratricopeptide (TPR) repeat protein
LRVVHRKKGEDIDAKRTRLLREAKAIARLSHPSVVVVYDVGTYQDQVFIAMELVEGMTAIRWRDTRKPSWREVLKVFIAAGEGIAAAHAADLIHRDFKPDNLMVTPEGKVRVMDFGLARTMDRITEETALPGAEPGGDEPTMPGSRPPEPRLTNDGNVVGTPAYMPPEQYLGVTDERSDQFSFCVSLYECVYGQHPFEARTSFGLSGNVQAGRVHEAPAHTKVPLWLRKILLRGMKPRPEERYPSMGELLDALGRDPSVARRRWLLAGGVLVAAGGLAFGVQRAADSKRAFCAAGPDRIAAAWELPGNRSEAPRRAAVRLAFAATGKPYAPDAIRSVFEILDDYARKWIGVYKDACEATHVRGDQSEDVLDLRMGCLNDRLSGMRALADVFSGATGEVVEHAVDAAHALTPIDGCSDVKQLKSLIPPPDPTVKARVEGLRRELGQIKAVDDAGRYAAALEQLKPVVDEARTLGYRPLEAEALLRMGRATGELGENVGAEGIFEQALHASVASHHDDLLAEISAWLVWVVGFQGRFSDADRWRRFAEAAIERSSVQESIAYSWLLNNVGVIYHLQGRVPESLEYQRRALAIKEKVLGPDDPDVAVTLGNMALTLNSLNRSAEGLSTVDRAMRILKRALGESHPRIADGLSNRGEILLSLGRPAEALAGYQDARRIWEREDSQDNPALAFALSGIGRSLTALYRPREALAPLESALAIRKRHGADGTLIGETEFALAIALWSGHRDLDRATALALSALAHYSSVSTSGVEKEQIRSWLATHHSTPTASR